MPETVAIPRIATAARFLGDEARTDVSAVIGLDVDLVLGYEYEIPDELSDADHAEALLAAFTDEAARVAALADMLDTGFINVSQSYGRLLVLADELERTDRPAAFDEAFVGGWAA
ncbi:hypothetical protein AB4212_04085 [Streptomyces sp. 2MCAF27]